MFGETIKKIRKSKNMTLKEVAGDSLSLSQLSRFENGKSMIPVNLFYEILDNLNTTSEEFAFIYQPEKNQKIDYFFERIIEYTNNNEVEKLKDLRDKLKAMKPNVYSWEQFSVYFVDSILETSELKDLDKEAFDQKTFKAQQPVLDYLMQVENWGEMELRVYAIFGFILDVETTHFLMHTALNKSKQYLKIPSARRLLHTILTNNFSTFLFNNRLDYAKETLQLFEQNYSEDTKELEPHIDFLFNKGLLAFKQNKPQEGKEYCEQAISICKLFKQKSAEKKYTERYESWQENYNDPGYKELMIKLGGV